MYELILSVISFKKNRGDDDFEVIVNNLECTIKKMLNIIQIKDREDVYQIVLMKLEELISEFRVIKINELSEKNREHFITFLKKDKKINPDDKDLDNYFSYYKCDFELYSNQNIFYKYIYKRVLWNIKKCKAKLIKMSSYEINNGLEFADKLIDVFDECNNELLWSAISSLHKKDKGFIIFYFFSRQANNEAQAALILKVTQQAISKRLNRIYKELRKIYINLVKNN